MNSDDDLYQLAAAAQGPPTYQYVAQTMTGVFCTTHPTAPAICYCQTCRAPVCGTCVFNFPGGIQLCPSCASNPRPQVSRHRKGLIGWSIAMACVSIVSLVLMVILIRQSHTKSDIEAMSTAIVFFSFMPAIVGLALGVGTYDRRLSMPPLAWVGIIGNGLIVLVWLIAMVAGMMR